LLPVSTSGADGTLQDGKDSQSDEERRKCERPRTQIIPQKLELPELFPARHGQTRSTFTTGARKLPVRVARDYSVASIPSSLSLRVRVLRPQPSSFAASWRCP